MPNYNLLPYIKPCFFIQILTANFISSVQLMLTLRAIRILALTILYHRLDIGFRTARALKITF